MHTPPIATLADGDISLPTAIGVVLDTNVVLDWLLFRDPGCATLVSRVESRQLSWYATASMRAELACVLSRPELQHWGRTCEYILSSFDLHAVLLPTAPSCATTAGLRCRDADDQKFIDLACAVGARWLLTRDKALLDLAKAARVIGPEILRPSDWTRRHGDVEAIGSAG